MGEQKETPFSIGADAFMQTVRDQGGFASGGRLQNFREGWALPQGHFGKAHYFTRRELDLARSICERLEGPAGGLFGAGNFPRCKTCAKRRAWVEAHRK